METVKPAKTIDEQIEILKNKGVLITDNIFAHDVLFSVNYYTFSGYLFQFKNKDGSYNNVSFEKIHNIYRCDKRIRSILLYAIEDIERNIKTKLAYSLAHSISPIGYTKSKYFVDVNEHAKFMKHFENNVNNNNRIPFVKHHIINYNGTFPIWVAVELFTLGMIWNCYKNLQTKYKKEIAQLFKTGVNQLENWIECVSYIRNFAAHDMRLYNFNMQKTPKHCKYNFKNFEQSNKLYDIVYVMKFLCPDKSEWNTYILSQFEDTFNKFQNYINIHCYGFPDDWKQVLNIE